jgi:DNA replication protein DnaC
VAKPGGPLQPPGKPVEELLHGKEHAPRNLSQKFPVIKSLDQFDFTAVPSLNKARILDLAQGEYLNKRENLILMGNSGTGKTHLATALGLIACQQGKKV